VDDPLGVRGVERLGDLSRDGQRLVRWHRPPRNPVGQRRTLDELHHERPRGSALFEAVDLRDVRMVQRREQLRLALEPGEPLGIVRERLEQHLDRNRAFEPRVARSINFSHATDTKRSGDFVGPHRIAGFELHLVRRNSTTDFACRVLLIHPQTKIEEGYRVLPITWEEAAMVQRLPLHHRDPFDRLLVAQSMKERYRLVPRDRIFRKYGIETEW
jgi:hypothetical protein